MSCRFMHCFFKFLERISPRIGTIVLSHYITSVLNSFKDVNDLRSSVSLFHMFTEVHLKE